MINITSELQRDTTMIDILARDMIPTTIGASGGVYGAILHLPDGTSASDQNRAQAILDNYDGLTVTADKTTMTEGDPDPIISCIDVQIVGDSEVGYAVMMDGEVYDSGTTPVVAGTATLTLVAPTNGIFIICIYRQSDSYASGLTTITVNEVSP